MNPSSTNIASRDKIIDFISTTRKVADAIDPFVNNGPCLVNKVYKISKEYNYSYAAVAEDS